MSLSSAEWTVKTIAVMAKKILGAGTTLKIYCFIFLLREGIFSQTYCPEGKVKVNCSYNIVSQNNHTKFDLIIEKNGSQVLKRKALPAAKYTAEIQFRLEENPSAVHSLDYKCVWVNSNNGLVLYKKNVSINRESLPKPPQNLSLRFIYASHSLYWYLEAKFSRNNNSNTTQYVISENFGLPGHRRDHSVSNKACPGVCKVFEGDVLAGNSYVVRVDAVSNTGICSSKPLQKLVNEPEIYRGFRNFSVREIGKRHMTVTWQNPRGCCKVNFNPGFTFTHVQVCRAGKLCENATFSFQKDKLQHELERLEPYTTYKIRMTIEWRSWGYREFAPWTSILETTLSEVPPGLPQKPICNLDSTGTGIKLTWKKPRTFNGKVNRYKLKLEQENHNDTTIEVNSSVCHPDVCSYTFFNIYPVKGYGLSVRACSNGGCTYNSETEHCEYTRKETKEMTVLPPKKYIVHIISGISAAVVALLFAFTVYLVIRKRRYQQHPTIPVVGPRPDVEDWYTEPLAKPQMYDRLEGKF